MIKTQIDHDSAWTSASVVGKSTFERTLSTSEVAAFESAVRKLRDRHAELESLERTDFDVQDAEQLITDVRTALDEGRGLVIVRGFPVQSWPAEDIELMFWGLGVHLGEPASQSVMGDRLGHVVDVSDVDVNARAYRSQRELSLHNDFGNYHAMLSLSLPKTGGESRYASAVSVHNVMLRESPHLLESLYRGYSLYRLGEQGPDELPYTPHRVPVFTETEGLLSSRYMRAFIEAAATLRAEPLEDVDVAALNAFDEIAHRDEVMVEFTLEPGEAAFYNNLFVLHARAAFEDDKPDVRRHLLRLWLYAEDSRPVVPEIEVFDAPGIPPQPGQSPSGEGELLRNLGATGFSKAALTEGRKDE